MNGYRKRDIPGHKKMENILEARFEINKKDLSQRKTRAGIIVLKEDDVYIFQGTEEDIWNGIDGSSLKEMIHDLCSIYNADYESIKTDTIRFISGLEEAGLIVRKR